MGNISTKYMCMWLPAQSGKTRKMQELIKEYEDLSSFIGTDGYVNIVICSNNRSLVQQTGARMADNSNVVNWISGGKEVNDVYNIIGRIVVNKTNMIICCANSPRLSHIKTLITELNNSNSTKKINIWIDEADESVKLWSKPDIMGLIHLPIIENVGLVSATFNSIIRKFGHIRNVRPFNETHLPIYHSIAQSKFIPFDYVSASAADYFGTAYLHYKQRIRAPGMKLFAPGDVERKSHDAIASILIEDGWVVAILNGERKQIVSSFMAPINLDAYIDISELDECTDENKAKEKMNEVGKIITNVYYEHHLYNYPFAITGNICLGRGITFQNDRFIFNCGIIPFIYDKAKAYQLMCRMAGNIKNSPKYIPSWIITPTKMYNNVIQMEGIAIGISKLVCIEGNIEINNYTMKRIANIEEDAKRDVPYVIDLTRHMVSAVDLHNLQRDERNLHINMIISANYPDLWARFYEYKYILQTVRMPGIDGSEYSYKTQVEDVIKASIEKRKFDKSIDKGDGCKNLYNVILDYKNNKLIIIIYHGATPVGTWSGSGSTTASVTDSLGM